MSKRIQKTPRVINFLKRTVFFLGWLLSPVTFWNDAFINIPLAYLIASLVVKVFSVDFLSAVLASYWLSNAVGIVMMYAAGKSLLRDKANPLREVLKLFLVVVIYSAILLLIGKAGILKPL